jgi:G3E family GTPase
MPQTPIYIITGFLGSGKTTFLRQVISYFEGRKKLAIVQNEFAPASFDGKELKRTTNSNFEILEINNGSVFCVCLLSGFIDSLKSFVLKYSPDVVFLEASGLSDPIAVAEIFNSSGLWELVYLQSSITVVDANNFGKFNSLLPRIKHQIMIADTILINKTDLAGNYKDIHSKVKELNPFGKVYETTFCNAPLNEIFLPESKYKIANKPKQGDLEDCNNRPNIKSAVFKTTKQLKKEYLRNFLHDIISKAIRLKGYILLDAGKSIAIQTVFEEVHTEELNFPVKQTELIAIGEEMDVQLMKRLYIAYAC